jgi:subtilisin family serine protease
MNTWRAAVALAAVALPLACFGGSTASAQSFIRSPNLNIRTRTPNITTYVAPRTGANVAVGKLTNVDGPATIKPTNVGGPATVKTTNVDGPATVKTTNITRTTPQVTPRVVAVRPTLPYVRYSPNLYPACAASGECLDEPISVVDGGGSGSSGKKAKGGGPRRNAVQTTLNSRTTTRELVAEIDGALSEAQADELARRHGLARLQSQNFPLVGATIGRFRIADGRTVETSGRELAADPSVRSVQPNFRYLLQDQKTGLTEGDPAQYANVKLRLPQAHTLARGANVTIAVIDSGIDAGHPELANSIADSFDALGSTEGPHVHGTAIAGAIVSHARLMGSAPKARILAIRAFGVASKGAESNSYVILKGLDYAVVHGAQIVNMSFAGPKDGLIERAIAAVAARDIVMVAAAGNAGAKSPPLYPAANPKVIAVSATDAEDKLFTASNRGSYIAVAAPGVDIFLPAPDEKYQMTSGTSFSAAYISGLAALLLERNPALKPDALRAILMKTARDLGSPGRDDLFGAGEADAYAAVEAVTAAPAPPVAAVPAPSNRENVSEQKEIPPVRAPESSAAAVAADKSATVEAGRPAAR